MEAQNLHWFHWMAAGYHPQPILLSLARLLAVYGAALAVLLVIWLGLRQRPQRMYLVGSLLVCMVGVLLAHRLAVGIDHPRPFVMGLSPVYIDHAARGSLPSVHATALFTIAFCLLLSPALRVGGWVALAIAALVAWGRVYCGVHFLLDMVAGAAMGLNLAVVYDWLWIRLGAPRWQRMRAGGAA